MGTVVSFASVGCSVKNFSSCAGCCIYYIKWGATGPRDLVDPLKDLSISFQIR